MNILTIKNVIYEQLNVILKQDNIEFERIDFRLEETLKEKEITVITGVRRSGKSTLTQQLIRKAYLDWNVHYINFEEQKLRDFTLSDFEAAYNEFMLHSDPAKKYLLVYDEIQNIEGWERWVSSFVTSVSTFNKLTKVIVTGSNAKLLGTELSTLLTGRHLRIEVSPFSFREVVPKKYSLNKMPDAKTSQETLELKKIYHEYTNYGGFPRAYTSKSIALLSQYHEDIVLKDIAVRKKVRNTSALQSLGVILASQNTRLFNKSQVALELGIKDTTTLNKFCSYFIETYLYSEVKCFAKSKRKQLRSLSKFYCVDPLMAKQVGYHNSDSSYWIVENLVFIALKRRYREIWYWQSKEKYEVDFVAKASTGELHAYQVSVSLQNAKARERELRALQAARNELKVTECFVITEYEEEAITNSTGQISVAPFYKWALER
jgi:hypothetical protein